MTFRISIEYAVRPDSEACFGTPERFEFEAFGHYDRRFVWTRLKPSCRSVAPDPSLVRLAATRDGRVGVQFRTRPSAEFRMMTLPVTDLEGIEFGGRGGPVHYRLSARAERLD